MILTHADQDKEMVPLIFFHCFIGSNVACSLGSGKTFSTFLFKKNLLKCVILQNILNSPLMHYNQSQCPNPSIQPHRELAYVLQV